MSSQTLAELWAEEAADVAEERVAALSAGDEARAKKLGARLWYLEYMAGETPRLGGQAADRAVADRRTWPRPSEDAVREAMRRLGRRP